MILVKSLDLRDKEVERNLKLVEKSKIKEVRLFNSPDPRSVRIGKNLPFNFK